MASYIIYEEKLSIDINSIENSLNPNEYIEKINKVKKDHERNIYPLIFCHKNKKIKSKTNTKEQTTDTLTEIRKESDYIIELILKLEIFYFLTKRVFELLNEFTEIFILEMSYKKKLILDFLFNSPDLNTIFSNKNLYSLGILFLLCILYKLKIDQLK